MHVLARDFIKQKLLYSDRTHCSPEKETNKQNCFLCQIFRLPNVHVVHKVHQIGDASYNLTFNKTTCSWVLFEYRSYDHSNII